MKRGLIAILMILLISNVNAQELVSAGILPGNPLYGIDKAIEKLQTGLSGQGIPRSKIHMLFAEERLAEAKALVDKNKLEKVPELVVEYGDNVAKANEELEKAKGIGLDVRDLIKQIEISTDKHIAVLELVLAKVPEQAKPGIERALENARKNAAERKEQEKKAGITDITGADVVLTEEELAKKEEELRQKEEELAKKEEDLLGKGLVSITGFASYEQEQELLKQRMGVIFVISLIGMFLYFYYINHRRHKDIIKRKRR